MREVGHEPTGARHLRRRFKHCPTTLVLTFSFHPPAEHLSCILSPSYKKPGRKHTYSTNPAHSPLGTMHRAPGPEASGSAGTGGQAMRVVLALLLAARVVLCGIGGAGFGKDAELGEDSMRRTFLAAGLWDAQLVVTEDNMQGEAVVLCHLQTQHGACREVCRGGWGNCCAKKHAVFISVFLSQTLREAAEYSRTAPSAPGSSAHDRRRSMPLAGTRMVIWLASVVTGVKATPYSATLSWRPCCHTHASRGSDRPSSGTLPKTALALEAVGSEALRSSSDFVSASSAAAAFSQHPNSIEQNRKSRNLQRSPKLPLKASKLLTEKALIQQLKDRVSPTATDTSSTTTPTRGCNADKGCKF